MTPEHRQRRIAFIMAAGLGGMMAALAGHLIYIQIVSSQPLAQRAARQHYMRMPIQPMRGNILDTRLRVLAGSVEAKSVYADPKVIEDPAEAAAKVAAALRIDQGEVYRKLTQTPVNHLVWLKRGATTKEAEAVRDLGLKGVTVVMESDRADIWADAKAIDRPAEVAARLQPVLGLNAEDTYRQLVEAAGPRFVWIQRRVSQEAAEAIRGLNLVGVGLVAEGHRNYPNGSLAAHVLGFVGVDEQGLEGIERLFNDRLRGRPGEAYVLADRRRRPIWIEPDRYCPAVDGQHLVLTIDATIQAITEEALAEVQKKFRAESASAVVMNPGTGAILAMANVPTFDPNRYADFPVEARRNRALTDTFPPGSSCKPFVACAALEAAVVRFGEVIYCEDGYWAEAKLHDAGHSYGNLTFEQGVAKSSNIMFGKLGVRLGNERLHEGLVRFGFGSRTGIWLPGEAPGLVYPVSRWSKLSTTRVAFGQEFMVTPLQMAVAFSAIANGGKLLKPKILRGALDSRGQVVADLSQPEVVGQPVSPSVARQLIDRALVAVVEEGTGTACRIPGYRVFGKTGTAQKIDPGTRTISHDRYMSSFLAGAPAERPQVVVCVMVNEPDKSLGYYGGTVAAPAARKILEQTLPYLGIPPSEPTSEKPGTHLVDHKVTD